MKAFLGIVGALTIAAIAPIGHPAFAQARIPTGLIAIKIAVSDFERAARFYTILGMTPGTKFNATEWELRWPDPARGSPITIVKDEDGHHGVPKAGAFMMIAVADVPATIARLRTAGFSIPAEPHRTPRATIAMIKDPDGNSIELLGGPFGAPAAKP